MLSSDELSLAAFAPAEGSKAIETPYGSLQLAGSALQQSFGVANLGGTLQPEESEEDDEDDDDDDEDSSGGKKRKRAAAAAAKQASAAAAGAGAKKAGAPAAASRPGNGASGERDIHTGRRKIRIEFIEDDSRRHITFSKRKAGIMKKAYELATLTGTQVLLLIVSQTGLVYTFTTPKLSPVVQQPAGRELIQSCLNAPEPGEGNGEEELQSAVNKEINRRMAEPSATSAGPSNANANMNAAHLAAAAASAAAQQHQHQQHGSASGNAQPSVYNPVSSYHDPRHQAALLNMANMPGMAMGIPAHMQGLGGAYGYAGLQQLVGHDASNMYGYGGV